jgi:hypothetical protein
MLKSVLTAFRRTCSFGEDLRSVSSHSSLFCSSLEANNGDAERTMFAHQQIDNLHNVPSTSNTIPFNTGLSSPLTFLAGFSGANRRGRTGRAIEVIDRVVAKHCTRLEG